MKLLKWFRNIDILSAEDQYKYATQYAISNILDSSGFTFKRIKSRIKEASKRGLTYLYITIEIEKYGDVNLFSSYSEKELDLIKKEMDDRVSELVSLCYLVDIQVDKGYFSTTARCFISWDKSHRK